MMRFRALHRSIRLACLLGVLYSAGRLAHLLPFDPWARQRLRNGALQWWGRRVLGLLHIRLELNGPLPPPAGLFVANHLSYVDAAVFAALGGGVAVVNHAMDEWPGFRGLARGLDCIIVMPGNRTRLRGAEQAMRAALARGERVVLFPEGTSSAGDGVLPFQSALLQPVVGLPVYWGALRYLTPTDAPPAHESIHWWGNVPFAGHLWRLMQIEGATARLTFGPPIVAADRKALARQLHAAISAALADEPSRN